MRSEADSREVIADQLPVCFVHGRLELTGRQAIPIRFANRIGFVVSGVLFRGLPA